MRQFYGLKEFIRQHLQIAAEFGYADDLIIKVVKPIYGLRQSGRNWQRKLRKVLALLGYTPLITDDSIYRGPKGALLATFVDDIFGVATTDAELDAFEEGLSAHLDIEVKDDVSHFLGIRIQRNGGDILIGQDVYVRKILEGFPENLKPTSTPIETNVLRSAIPLKVSEGTGDLKGTELEPADLKEYQQLIVQI